MNALDVFEENRLLSWDREVDDLALLGYQSEELDLREYWDAPLGALESRLSSVDLLWVVGGNAFVLARAATAAGLGAGLDGCPHLTYAGYSAGACLTSIDLAGIEFMDDESALPPGYRTDMSALTLNLTGTRIVPHAGSDDALAASSYLTARSLTFIEIADREDELFERTYS